MIPSRFRSVLRDFLFNGIPVIAISSAAGVGVSTTLAACAAQKPACQIIKLADEACVMIEGKDGVRVKVPAAELHRVALEAQLRLDASASPSASASPVPR